MLGRGRPGKVGTYVSRAARRSCQLSILALGLQFKYGFSLKGPHAGCLVPVGVLRRWGLMGSGQATSMGVSVLSQSSGLILAICQKVRNLTLRPFFKYMVHSIFSIILQFTKRCFPEPKQMWLLNLGCLASKTEHLVNLFTCFTLDTCLQQQKRDGYIQQCCTP